jgi:hypothetical protein
MQVSATGRLGSESPQVPCEGLAEFPDPAADRLVAGFDATLRQHLLDIPQAEGEPEVDLYDQADEVRREPVSLEGDRLYAQTSAGRAILPRNGESAGSA